MSLADFIPENYKPGIRRPEMQRDFRVGIGHGIVVKRPDASVHGIPQFRLQPCRPECQSVVDAPGQIVGYEIYACVSILPVGIVHPFRCNDITADTESVENFFQACAAENHAFADPPRFDRLPVYISPEPVGKVCYLPVAFRVVFKTRRHCRARPGNHNSLFYQIVDFFQDFRPHPVLVRQDEHPVFGTGRQFKPAVLRFRVFQQDFGVDIVEIVAFRQFRIFLRIHDRHVLSDEICRVGDMLAGLEQRTGPSENVC